MISDLFDQLKSRTKGYASMSFTDIGFRSDKLVLMEIRINGDDAPPLASIVHRDKAHDLGKLVCNKLKELIPRQQFKVGRGVFICMFCVVCGCRPTDLLRIFTQTTSTPVCLLY